ncbi:4-alpha-glucanotransferase [Spirochaeta isovalerica]|uniref:4-alpha-glucanotransferase n=1 Tax=Spirochaeta isovalerica TaxID=150 RepID=A0A841RE68_9SPIO|nr:4-alpha-glucanotransferase [Spirochaeta isovalerica]MBB6482365.1 4-alpha-glucanotransferase [Spirochaeta isovalerica]
MKFPPVDHKLTGVVVPVFSLRSEKSCGIGEFADLAHLGEWCRQTNLDLIQILPVNDTGYQESPYSALSAFALHPIFMRLEDIPESKDFAGDIAALKKELEPLKRVSFASVLTGKLEILRKIYDSNIKSIRADKAVTGWMKENPWVKNYAVFSTIRRNNLMASWKDWKNFRNPSAKDLDKLWDKYEEDNYFHVWVQYHLEKQLKDSAAKLDSMGISLKGDIPILMNEDSCDVWADRKFFDLSLSAGAPPDMFSTDGQNWGFPVYNWTNLKKDDYSWWRKRLKQAAKFYHAYRIDHVLGFFRIWNIPFHMVTGSMGYFNPSAYISRKDLEDIGFDKGRITWMSRPHVFEHELREKLGAEAESVINICLDRIGNENLFLFNDTYSSEKVIYRSDLSDKAKSVLGEMLKNVTLIPVDDDNFSLSWSFRETRGYESLNQWEKGKIEELSARCGAEAEKIWEENALNLLSFMKNTTDMLVCAEDLGAVPDCVPSVLQKLGILGLKVVRWAREWGQEGDPYTKVSQYPELSVCTPAVHDSTTLRQWWFEEQDKAALAAGLDVQEIPYDQPGEEAVKFFLEALFRSRSAICMIQIQDFFALDSSICDSDIHFERINIPGTVQDVNWSYRMTPTVEKLMKAEKLKESISSLVEIRKNQKITL